jgi:hypothetical protein
MSEDGTQKPRREGVQRNDLLQRVRASEMDQEVVAVYERYVMAQVWAAD